MITIDGKMVLYEDSFIDEDEPREEVREMPKHKNHEGRDDNV